MNLDVDKKSSRGAIAGNAQQENKNAQSYQIKLSEILKYSDPKNHQDAFGEFKLPNSSDAFVENAKAFGFEYMGVDCAYIMAKVLGEKNHTLWLAIEIHQYKDSWGLDAGEISWLYLKNGANKDEITVEQLNLLPLNLFTDYETIEAKNALNSIGAPFEDDLDFIEGHSRVILKKFASPNSMNWLRDLSMLGYSLSQFSLARLQHPQTKIDIRNALVPFLIEMDDVSYKAMSYLVQLGSEGVHNTIWITHFVGASEDLKLDKCIISFGQYAADLTVCKAPSRSVVEGSYIASRDDLGNGALAEWLEQLALDKNEISHCIESVRKTLNWYFDEKFVSRLMLKNDYVDQPVSVADLSIDNISVLKEFLQTHADTVFTVNIPLYYSASSFASLFYQPNKEYSLIEDYVQPVTLNKVEVETIPETSEYDFKQPDFNEENKIEKLFSQHTQQQKKPFQRKPYNGHNNRQAYFQQLETVDEQIEKNEVKRASKYQKKSPLIRQKHRFKGVVDQAKQSELTEHISNVQADLRESGEVARFLSNIQNLPKDHQEIHNLEVADIEQRAEQQKRKVVKAAEPVEKTVPVKATEPEQTTLLELEMQTGTTVADASIPVKEPKKRGRPSKKVEEAKEGVEVAQEPKRRGRPPKKVEGVKEEVEVTQEEVKVTQEPKRRGRPPKKKVEGVKEEVKVAQEEVKVAQEEVKVAQEEVKVAQEPKRRGRPPKKKVEGVKEQVEVAQDEAKVAQDEAKVAQEPKRRGRPPKKAVEVVEASPVTPVYSEVAEQQVENSLVVDEPTSFKDSDKLISPVNLEFTVGKFKLYMGDEIRMLDTTYKVSSNFPVALIKENPNYLFNSFVGHGMDKFSAVEILEKLGCEFAEYSFHELQRKLQNASTLQLTKYDGFEKYISECEYEIYVRR